MSNTTTWINTVMRSRSVAPTHGVGMGDVCPQALGHKAGYGVLAAASRQRHFDAAPATLASAPPWSPPGS
jgi:hypothetical protein